MVARPEICRYYGKVKPGRRTRPSVPRTPFGVRNGGAPEVELFSATTAGPFFAKAVA